MRSSPRSKGREVIVIDSSMTFENFRFPKSTTKKPNDSSNKCNEIYKNENFAPSEFTADVSSVSPENNLKKMINELQYSDVESNFTSISKVIINTTENPSNKSENCETIFKCNGTTDNSKSVFTHIKEGLYQSYNGEDSALSISTKEYESDESFLTIVNSDINKYGFINPKEDLASYSKPLRLFNKNGKPLTDRVGRPLIDILGQPLVVLDDKGRIISDSKGNQIFNSLGESAIYSSTNLHIPPSDEEPGIPLLDVDKRHILFLYDNKGHPLTDALGRPLLKASGSLMFGMKSKLKKQHLNNNQLYQLKNMYSKAPLENFVRRVQIFNFDLKPLTDESGRPLKSNSIICNKNGMPICDESGRSLYFKYGTRIITQLKEDCEQIKETTHTTIDNPLLKKSRPINNLYVEEEIPNSINKSNVFNEKHMSGDESKPKKHSQENQNHTENQVGFQNIHDNKSDINTNVTDITNNNVSKLNQSNKHHDITANVYSVENKELDPASSTIQSSNSHKVFTDMVQKDFFGTSSQKDKKNIDFKQSSATHGRHSKEAIVLFDASKKMENQKSSLCTMPLKNIKKRSIGHSIIKRKASKKMYTSNFIEYFKNALNLTSMKQSDNNRLIYNDYGKPMKDFYGNLLYDKFGIPLTGAQGIKLCEKARHSLRLKLRNIPVVPVNKEKIKGEIAVNALATNESHDQFGDPFYDKYGRPLYDLFGKLIYDVYGRPLTDAFGRPLIDAIGQPLMDSQGNVLTSEAKSRSNVALTDIFGRYLYDKRGRALFDSYGRPRYDIFTNAIYDNCGRPAMDSNGNVLFDFLNKPIQVHPEKPLYRNARVLLPRYIDRILAMPSMHRVLKYSRASLKDAFGGPLFDDFGRPLYNKIGKPLYDKYGRPLYDKDGRPQCDCYGRPLSEEIRKSPNDLTLSVVDSLKLLKLTKESSKWMEIKRSQTHCLKPTESDILDNAIVMKVVQPAKKKSTQYTYALTRVTRFSCGRQALEILEAPLSPATATDMHHLPVDNKPLIMVARRRHRVVKKHRPMKRH